MSFIINQNFDLKSPQFNFTRDYYKDIATLKAESEDNFPDHFITNVAGTLYQLTKSNSVDAITGKWRELKFALNDTEIDANGYATKEELKDVVNHIFVGASVNNESGDTSIAVKNDEEGYSLNAVIPEVSDKLNGVMTPAQKKALETATTKLAGVAEGANKTVVDAALSNTSTNPVQNKIVNAGIEAAKTAASTAQTIANNAVTAAGKAQTTATAAANKLVNVTDAIEVCDNTTIDSIFNGTYGK